MLCLLHESQRNQTQGSCKEKNGQGFSPAPRFFVQQGNSVFEPLLDVLSPNLGCCDLQNLHAALLPLHHLLLLCSLNGTRPRPTRLYHLPNAKSLTWVSWHERAPFQFRPQIAIPKVDEWRINSDCRSINYSYN